MSAEQEIEAAQRAYAGFNAADPDAMCAAVDPAFRFYPMLSAAEGGYWGHEGIRSWLAEMVESFSDQRRHGDHSTMHSRSRATW